MNKKEKGRVTFVLYLTQQTQKDSSLTSLLNTILKTVDGWFSVLSSPSKHLHCHPSCPQLKFSLSWAFTHCAREIPPLQDIKIHLNNQLQPK